MHTQDSPVTLMNDSPLLFLVSLNLAKDNHSLKSLGLENCSMTDVGLEHLANSLLANRSLNQLYLYNIGSGDENHITGKSVLFLTKCLKNNSTLEELSLPADFKSSTDSI